LRREGACEATLSALSIALAYTCLTALVKIRKLAIMITTSCATPGCANESAEESRFCVSDRDNLARIRGELQAEMKKKGAYHRRGQNLGPKCCTPGCLESRKPPAFHCEEHLEAIYGSEDN
jgi:hypothetical protein